jgi:hypothetical protein
MPHRRYWQVPYPTCVPTTLSQMRRVSQMQCPCAACLCRSCRETPAHLHRRVVALAPSTYPSIASCVTKDPSLKEENPKSPQDAYRGTVLFVRPSWHSNEDEGPLYNGMECVHLCFLHAGTSHRAGPASACIFHPSSFILHARTLPPASSTGILDILAPAGAREIH